ncbi:MAG: chemotaxis protein CheW [Gemmatimonadales bacterium]
MVCRVGDFQFSLPVAVVLEVCTETTLVRVPGVASPVEGVANIRGTLVTIVRAADLLGVRPAGTGPSPWLVVLRARGGRVGLGVEAVLELAAADASVARLDLDGALESVFGRST